MWTSQLQNVKHLELSRVRAYKKEYKKEPSYISRILAPAKTCSSSSRKWGSVEIRSNLLAFSKVSLTISKSEISLNILK